MADPTTMNRTTMRAIAAAVALAMAGCAVGPDYKRPGTVLPDAYSAGVPTDIQPAAAAIPNDWWKLYDDPTLDQLVTAALNNNPNVRLAIAQIEEARGVLRETNAALFPEVGLNGAGSRARIGSAGGSAGGGSSFAGSGSPRLVNIYQLSAGVSYELDLWGKLRRASEAAAAQLAQTQYAKEVTTLSLASTTAQSYFGLRSLDAQIEVTQNTLKAVGESLDIAKKRLDAGYSSALDYSQAETLRAQTAVQLRELRRQRIVQEHQLGRLTSQPNLQIPAGALGDVPVPILPPPGLPSTLLERRPDVAASEQQVVAANANIGVAKAGLFPTFSLTGAYGGQSFDFSDLLKAPFRFWSIGLGISQPIFAAGKYMARVDQARARTDQQVASYQDTVEQAFQEVADALTNVSETNATESEIETQVNAAKRTLKLSRQRYQQGYAPYLDVLDATRTANAASILLVQNRASRLNYTVDLVKALGGGWQGVDLANSGMTVAPRKPLDLDPGSNPPGPVAPTR